MNWKNSDTRFGSASIALHWLMALLIVAVYALMEFREFFPSASYPREMMKAWHFTLGLLVFLLVWVRLFVRLTQRLPRIEPELVRWQQLLSIAVHLALYGFMIVMPVLGWLVLSGEGETSLFNGLNLPALIGVDKEFAHTAEEVHVTIGNIGYLLIGLHAVAALFHHYFLKDNTLVRMLPRSKKHQR